MKQNYHFKRHTFFRAFRIAVATFCVLIAVPALSQVANKPKSPIMGWASWNNFFVGISDPIIKSQANAMVSSGLASAGYKYINIDDGFFDGRNADGTLKINTVKFPNGMKSLVDYIHSKGLKAGFYSDAGANTCGSQYNGQTGGVGGGMYKHDQQDADLFFTTWGFDFLKVDYCGGLVQKLDEKARYTAIKTAIDNTGRTDVNFNVCRWQFPGTWVTKLADSWRISQDISYNQYVEWDRVLYVIDCNAFLAAYSSQGHYNDMDMMEVGRGLTFEEDKSHFSMWCILSAPLVLGNDLTKITKQTKEILTNAEVIAVDQDTTGVQGKLVSDNGAGLQVWAKNLNGKQSKERAVVLFNRSGSAASITVNWRDLNLVGTASVRDLWSHTDLGSMDSSFTAVVPSHGVIMLKVVGTQTKLQEVFEAEYAWINNFNLTKNSVVIANQGRAATDASCSGRAKASWLGSGADNYIEFRDVYAETAGSYKLTVSYISGENRNATLSVNAKDTLLSKLNSGGWSTIKKSTFAIRLNTGYNTIRFSNATGWMPDLDKIQLDLNKFDTTFSSTYVLPGLPIKVYPNPCNSFLHIDSESPVIQADIYSMTGCLLKKYGALNISVDDLSTGTYLLKVVTEKGKETRLVIKN